jgi:hypothetical protein
MKRRWKPRGTKNHFPFPSRAEQDLKEKRNQSSGKSNFHAFEAGFYLPCFEYAKIFSRIIWLERRFRL